MNKNYDYLTGDLLQARFPYMFNTKHNGGCEFHRGWTPICGCCPVRRSWWHWEDLHGQRHWLPWAEPGPRFLGRDPGSPTEPRCHWRSGPCSGHFTRASRTPSPDG